MKLKHQKSQIKLGSFKKRCKVRFDVVRLQYQRGKEHGANNENQHQPFAMAV